MTYTEETGNLFDVDFSKYTFVHCIAADLQWGGGIAPVLIRDQFGAENLVRYKSDDNPNGIDNDSLKSGMALLIPKEIVPNKKGQFINLITKEKSYEKPTYLTMAASLNSLKGICMECGIRNLAMPKIGCGIDQLDWRIVRLLIKGTFSDSPVEILVRNKD